MRLTARRIDAPQVATSIAALANSELICVFSKQLSACLFTELNQESALAVYQSAG